MILAVALAVAGAAVQDVRPLASPPAFVLDQWTTRDGLPQNSVNAIAQAPDGHLWIGTFGGLVRFDGATFRAVERTDSAGRHVDRVLSMAVGPDSALWIGTEQGLLRLKNNQYRAYTSADGLPDDAMSSVHVDRVGGLWLGTARSGLVWRAAGATRFERIPDVQGAAIGPVSGIEEDTEGTLWITAGDRLLSIARGTRTPRAGGPAAPGAVELVLQDRAGARWFGLNDGVAVRSGGGVRVYRGEIGSRRPMVMVEDPGGGYWLGTLNDGLFFFQPDAARDVGQRYALPDGRRQYRLRSALVDVEGNVWFGTDANGLLRAKRNIFTTYTTTHGLSHDVMTAVLVGTDGVAWAATNCGGLNALDLQRGTVRVYKPRKPGDPTGDPCVFSLAEAPAGTMWVGTYGGGLTRLRGGREERLYGAGGLRDSVVVALFADHEGTVWVGTNTGGLAALRDGRVRAVYTTADGLAHNGVRTIYQTRDGALWIGTLGGLSRLVNGRITSYRAADGLSAEHVRAIHEDAAGDLWIGTYGGGLNRLHDGRFSAVTREQGLADEVVSSILEDASGRFWMSGNRGIYRAARADLVAFTEGRIRHVHSVLYGAADGLQETETNGGFQPAAWRDAQGRMWFPTVRGLTVVDPAHVAVVERAPPVTISEVLVNGVARPFGERIVVGPGRSNLEFRYGGLSLSGPQYLTFRYRLERFDDDWVEAGARRVAYYPRLPPGSYTFTVTAANRDGVWNDAGASVGLRVVALFWNAWWFRLATAGGLAALGVALWRRREAAALRWRAAQELFSRQLIEGQEHERKRIAGELHDGLGQELLVVKNRALLALQADGLAPPVRDQVQHIHDVAARSLESVRGLAHHLTPYQLDHLGLTAALRAMVEEMAAAVPIAIEATIEDIDGQLPAGHQIDLYRIVQEALSNVVHHSGARAASVHVRRSLDAIAVTVRDDGRGFVVHHVGDGRLVGGFGLSTIAERARMLRGRVDVASAPGEGTRLELVVPAAAAAETGRRA